MARDVGPDERRRGCVWVILSLSCVDLSLSLFCAVALFHTHIILPAAFPRGRGVHTSQKWPCWASSAS